jgi:bis(5'-nucleosyl)-tetraphosphatase (symmetrical)
MRTIVIGDVHGCLDECRELIAKVDYHPGEDELVFLGDLIDKGPDPVGVVRYVRELKAACIGGNHEEKMLRWRRHEDRRLRQPSYRNPMREIPDELRTQWEALSPEDVSWIRNLPLILQLPNNFVAVHGGFLPGLSLDKQPSDKIIRVRWVDAAGEFVPLQNGTLDMPDFACPWMDVWDGEHHVVYGHAVHGLREPRIDITEKNYVCVGLDTGCVHGGRLSAMVLVDGQTSYLEPKIVQVAAKRVYKARPTTGE